LRQQDLMNAKRAIDDISTTDSSFREEAHKH
jgi:hypothetical protein